MQYKYCVRAKFDDIICEMTTCVDMCYILSLWLSVTFFGPVDAISNAPNTIYQKKFATPVRRFYFLHPEFIPHAAAALNMLIPHPMFNPYNQYPQQFAEPEEVEESPEHVPTPVQLLTFIKQKQQKKRVKKKKPNGARVTRVKKGPQKCMPFRVRFIKKADVGMSPFRRNYIVRRPLMLERQHPRNNFWKSINPWRLATPGKPVTEFPLEEPIPSVVGGSPPSSPIYNVYEDTRIPLHEAYTVPEAVTPNYVHLHQPTATPFRASRFESQTEVYSDPDYYRFGTYQTKTQPSRLTVETKYEDYRNASSTENVVTITPTSSWVPLPQYYRVTQTVGNKAEEPLGHVTTVYKFGDKIHVPKNCSMSDCRSV